MLQTMITQRRIDEQETKLLCDIAVLALNPWEMGNWAQSCQCLSVLTCYDKRIAFDCYSKNAV